MATASSPAMMVRGAARARPRALGDLRPRRRRGLLPAAARVWRGASAPGVVGRACRAAGGRIRGEAAGPVVGATSRWYICFVEPVADVALQLPA